MGEAARLAEASGAAIIDINMGCPAKKVTGGYAGSALMRDLDLATNADRRGGRGAVSVPVTVKMRLGWDEATPQRAGARAAAPRRSAPRRSRSTAARASSSTRAAPIGARIAEVVRGGRGSR